MKKLRISIILLAVLLLAFAGLGLANTEGMQDLATGKPTYRVYGFDRPGEIPVYGMIRIEQIYAEDAKAYQAVFCREDGTEYQTYNISRETGSVWYQMDECGEYTLTIYACTWPDNVATPTDLLPYESTATPTDLGTATPTDLEPYGSTATPTDLTTYRSAAGDPVTFRVTSIGPVLQGENPQVVCGNVPAEVPWGEPLELALNWGNKALTASAQVYHDNQLEEEEECLVYGYASRGETLTLSTWQLTPGETYRAEVSLSALGYDNVTQDIVFTVTDNGQGGMVDGWQWTLTEDRECQIGTSVSVGVYYPDADYIRIREYINGEYYTESYGRNGSVFLNVNTDKPGRITFRAEVDIRPDGNFSETIESVCTNVITISEGIQAPSVRLISEPVQTIGENVILKFVTSDTKSPVQYDITVQYDAEYNTHTICALDGSTPGTNITLSWPELEECGIQEGTRLSVNVSAHGPGFYPSWCSQTIYMIGAEDENFRISVESIDILAEHPIVYRNEPYEIQINGIPEGISEIDILNNMTWQSYALTESETQSFEMDGIWSHEDTPVVARYQTENEEYRYSNIILLTPIGQGIMPEPLVSTNLGEEAGYIDRGESIKIRLDNLDEYQVPVRLCACIVKRTGNPNMSYVENSCVMQDENTVLRIATGMLPADQDDYILKVWAKDRNDKWDQSQAIEIPFTLSEGIEQGTIRIIAAAGDVETEGDIPLQVITGENFTVSAYAPGASRIIIYDVWNYGDGEDYPLAETYGSYVEFSSSTVSTDTLQYYAAVYYPGEDEAIRSNTVTVQVRAPYGNLFDKLKAQIPMIVTPGESFTIGLYNVDEESDFNLDTFDVFIEDQYNNYVWNGYTDKGLSVTVPAKDRDNNDILMGGKQYNVYIQAYKKGYDGLWINGHIYAVVPEMQHQAELTINGESEQADLLTYENYTVSVTGLPENVTAVSIMDPISSENWTYYVITDGETSVTYDNLTHTLMQNTSFCARFTTQTIAENQNWDKVDWEGYTNTVDVFVSTRGPLPTPVVSTNLTEIVENEETKLCVEIGDAIVVKLENAEDYIETDRAYLSGSILKVVNGYEEHMGFSGVSQINMNNNQVRVSTGNLPLQNDNYILRLRMLDYSEKWDQSAAIDIPFYATANTQIGEIRVTTSATEVMTGETYEINVFAPGAERLEIYIGDYTNNYWYSNSWECFWNYENRTDGIETIQYFAKAYYPDVSEPIQSEIVTIHVTAPYGNLNDQFDLLVPKLVVPGEPLIISIQNYDNSNVKPDRMYVNISDWNTGFYYSMLNDGPVSETIIPTDDWQSGRNYRVEVSASKKGYNACWAIKTVCAFSSDAQQGNLTINNEDEQIELQTGDYYTVSVTGLPEGVTAVSVPIPELDDEWSYHTIADGDTSVTYSYGINYPVTHQKVFARYTTQAVNEYQDWSAITWTGYTNVVDFTAICTHIETYERYEWDEDSTCTADNKNTHTHTGHGEKWKVCNRCGEKLELLEEVTSLTEEHSYSDGICYVCGYECPHDPEDIAHEKYLNGDRTYVDEYVHHVSGIYVEHDYCSCCGQGIGETTETPVDQDENHHYDEWYYCNECYYQSTENHYLNVTCDWEYGDVLVALHGDKTLSITNAESDLSDTITYQWYLYDRDGRSIQITGATEPYYVVEDITNRTEGYVHISDGYTYRNCSFVINIDNGFTAYAENYQNDLTVRPNETATMNVAANCNYGELTYQWYERIDYEEEGNWYSREEVIADATGSSYTTEAIADPKAYYCYVVDEYGNSTNVWFYIYIDNELTVYAQDYREDITALPGETVTLHVVAHCYSGNLAYQWFRDVGYEENGTWYSCEEIIENANGASYETEEINGNKNYFCHVTDDYGHGTSISFRIHLDSGLTISAQDNQSTFTVQPGETVTMSVVASCNVGGLRYQWYKRIRYEEAGEWYSYDEIIENATEPSYTTDGIMDYTEYTCYAYDDFGIGEGRTFYIYIDSKLTAEPDGAYVFHASETPITLAVNASNLLPGTEFIYDWYSSYFGWLDSTTDSTYTLTNPDAGEYYCIVNDGHKTATVWFYVAERVFAQACGNSGYGVKPNEQVTLKVAAWNAQNDITYQWFDNDGAVIDGETQAVYSFNATRSKNVYCHVEGTDLNENIWFSVNIGSLQIDPPAMKKVYIIPADESIQIVRNITSTYDKNPSITWIKDNEVLPGEVSNTLTVSTGGKYVFKATDCYGNVYEYSFWCVEGEPETVSEWDTVYGKTDTENTICQFIPSEDGIYQFEGNCEIYKAGSEDILIRLQWPDIIRLEAGQVYYVVLYNSSNSFRYGLIQKDQEEYSITLQLGHNFQIPDLVINASGYSVYNSISDNQEVVYSDGYYFETLSTGTANLTVNYSCQVQRIYHITVVDASVVTLPDALQTIEEGAFDGDTSIRFIRLGSNVQTVKSGAFANTGDITVIVENGNTVFENGAFTNANPLIICQNDGNVAWYCNGNRIPYLMD